MTAATTIIIFAMTTIQSKSLDVESAGRRYWYWFILYIASLVLVAIVTWVFTLKSGELQNAIKADAEAKIAAANAEAAKANEGVANAKLEIEKAKEETAKANAEAAKANEGLAKSNEEIARLTAEAEKARADIAGAQADAAKANKDATNAAAEVARLQIVVANAEKERAEAQRALLELQERIKPRHLTAGQREQLIKMLGSARQKGVIELRWVLNDTESQAFASEFEEILKTAGWVVSDSIGGVYFPTPKGMGVVVHSAETAPLHAPELVLSLRAVGLSVSAEEGQKVPEGVVRLVIGVKP
jgi:hypothetical protein